MGQHAIERQCRYPEVAAGRVAEGDNQNQDQRSGNRQHSRQRKMRTEARKTEERAERNREAAPDERHDPDDRGNGSLGSKQSLLPCVPELREGSQEQRMQVPI